MTRCQLREVGQVQGVGFRPYVVRVARSLRLVGSVRNAGDGVWIDAQGVGLSALERALREAPEPIEAHVAERREVPHDATLDDFVIVSSTHTPGQLPTLPPDRATCAACQAEHDDPADRRHGYGLISCVACGPRYSLAGAPPFDRVRTAMAAFPLCEACQREVDDPDDRRFHAQVVACPACGPRVSMSPERAAASLRAGRIVAVKGASGFQLLCDAGDAEVVRRVRARKRRPDKPLAVMSLDAPLQGPEAPILLGEGPPGLAPEVGRGVTDTGWMGPPTAVHRQILRAFGGPVVCTSANRSGEPLATEAHELQGLADDVVDHDRAVWRPADDSVVRRIAGEVLVLRRARGHAPRPLPLGRSGAPLLAFGADLTSSPAVAVGDQAVLSPHLGALGSRPRQARYEAELSSLLEVYGVEPEQLVCDAHPDLVSTRTAEDWAAERGVKLLRVHHHHAHVAAVCAEHGLDEPVLGLAWDGVGFGADGTTWGGEVLQVHGAACERVAHLRPFPLLGGDAATREPGRVALALLSAAGLPADETGRALHPRAEVLWRWLRAEAEAPACTSMGRLFDGFAALLGGPLTPTWQAQGAVYLQDLARRHGPAAPFPLDDQTPGDWRPWVRAALREPPERAAARVHATIVAWAMRVTEDWEGPVVLSGGCFQNPLLAEGVMDGLVARGQHAWLPRQVPPGDGGIALGQAWVARRM